MAFPNIFRTILPRTTKLERLQKTLTDLLYSIEEHQQEIASLRREISTALDESRVTATAELTREKINDLILALEAWQKKLNKF